MINRYTNMEALFGLILLISTVYAGRTPSISWITKEQVVNIGDDISLECSVQYAEEYPVLWVKKGISGHQDLPISTNTALIVRDPRYELRHDQSSSNYILLIKQLQENDGGEYMCQVLVDLTNRVSASVELLVRRPPVISDNSTRSVVANENTMVTLECYAGGMPIPKVSWRRENNALLPTGGSVFLGNTLRIPSIKKEDRGTYYCIAENGVGRGARRNINVEVEFKPFVFAQKPVVYQALTFDAILECRVESYPPAAISWVFEHDVLVNNQHYETSQFATADEFTDTTLRVLTIEKRQYGNYTCRANNKLGGNEAYIILIAVEEGSSLRAPSHPQRRYLTTEQKLVHKKNATIEKEETNSTGLFDIACQRLHSPRSDSKILAKGWSIEFAKMRPDQQLYAKKFIDNILFEGRLGNLHINSVIINHSPLSVSPPSPGNN